MPNVIVQIFDNSRIRRTTFADSQPHIKHYHHTRGIMPFHYGHLQPLHVVGQDLRFMKVYDIEKIESEEN